MSSINAQSFQPLADRILVKRLDKVDERTPGGIIIPDSAQEKPLEAEVIAIGPGARDTNGSIIPLSVSIGDTVLFAKWGGTEVKLGGEEYLIMKESDVLGILNPKNVQANAA